jgi:hypothetical protein
MPTHKKHLEMQQHFQREAQECKFEDNFNSLRIWYIWITFATTWFIFTKQIILPISMSKTLVLAKQNIFQE